MKQLATKILIIQLIGFFIISCGESIVSNSSDKNQYKGVDWVLVYQNDKYDSIPKDKIIYQMAWGNTLDSLKPKFDISFCKENFSFPYYFPSKEQLVGNANQTIFKVKNEHLQVGLRTNYMMTYGKDGRITKYSIYGPSTIYSSEFVYDDKNRIQQISDGWKKINIIYNDFDNIEKMFEVKGDNETVKTLKFTYSYVAFSRH